MNKQRGLSLVELVIFIVILGVMVAGLLGVFTNVLHYSNEPGQNLKASQLALARINAITLQRISFGFNSINDPCTAGSPAACVALDNFATSEGLSVVSSIPAAVSGVRSATITISGFGHAVDTVRFVQ